jgi:signal transduction histidine kinase/ActR/RegA family two-component response regulator
VSLVLLVAWFFAFLERRETARLGRLVEERTAELNATNTRLSRQVGETVEKTVALTASEERYRRLNAELESRVGERTAELSNTNADLKREIAERQGAEEEREKLHAQLAQAQKMESVGRLAGGVAHDFNNMLQSILGNVALALEDLPPGGSVRENLEEIQKSGQRSAELTRQLLAFARKQTIQPKILDLNDTVSGMLKMLRRLIGEDIHLAWLPGAGLWPVKMDPSQIDQVLANLCVNARDAIAGVGKVTIETGNVTLADNDAQNHPDWIPGDYVLLTVNDNGRGMDAETRTHLFEPFFTTKELGKGTGLGLATVFGTIIQNQGLIHVDSEEGRGTTFKIYLPRAKAEGAAVAQGPDRRSMRGTETVLLVEDEEQILNLGRRILQQYGYTVLALATPQAALALAAQHSGPLHLLVTDVVMPGMNGKELRDRLRTSHPELKCLFMSGYTADVIADNGVLDDGVHFIQKPFTIGSLVETVRSACEAD